MNKRIKEKLKLFVASLKNRYEESSDFFVGMKVELISGRKIFHAEYKEQLYYNKEYLSMDLPEAIDFMVDESAKYDGMKMIYQERGEQVIVSANERDVKITREERKELPTKKEPSSRNYFIKPSQAQKLLFEIGIMTKDGKIKNDKIRKYNQIDHFIEVVEPLIQSLPRERSITILDAACGKSYLTFVLNHYIVEVLKRKCHILGVDYNQDVIDASRDRAKRLGYQNTEFIRADLNRFEPDRKVDLLVSLHACDNATDYAIATGVRLGATAMVVVPCCHKEFIDKLSHDELEPILKHNIFKVRFNDMFTDALRSLYLESKGYEVSPLEYVSPLDTPKNIMIRALKKSDGNERAKKEYEKIKQMFGLRPIIDAIEL